MDINTKTHRCIEEKNLAKDNHLFSSSHLIFFPSFTSMMTCMWMDKTILFPYVCVSSSSMSNFVLLNNNNHQMIMERRKYKLIKQNKTKKWYPPNTHTYRINSWTFQFYHHHHLCMYSTGNTQMEPNFFFFGSIIDRSTREKKIIN